MRTLEQFKVALTPSPEEWDSWTAEEQGKAVEAAQEALRALGAFVPHRPKSAWIVGLFENDFDHKIELIKWLRSNTNRDLLGAKRAVEALPETPIQVFGLHPGQEKYLTDLRLAVIEWR